MDCNHARLLLHFVRPGSTELEALDLESLRHHLADCPDCGAGARAEQRFDEAVGRAMHSLAVPQGLRERVLERLAKEAPGRHRRRLLTGLAAAVLLLAAGVTWLIASHKLEVQMPEQMVYLASKEAEVETWFANQGIRMEVPGVLNPDLLRSYGIAIHQGRRVARLVYQGRSERGGPAIAEVFVLSDRDFLLDPPQPVSSGGRTAEHLPTEQPGFLFLIIHDGGSWTVFKKHHGVA
jgi:hypothetical protein